jgi:predicted HAD superfamily Cof-like phosphohydrolase
VKRIILDSLVDQMYVLLGTIEMMDMEDIFEEAFDEVHRSNMTKTLYPVYSRSGKLLKGDHYEAPNLYPILKKKLK